MEDEYIVQHGDSLSSISQRLFGVASKWPQLARRNGIHAPYRIFTGQVLHLDNTSGASPASSETSDRLAQSAAPPSAAMTIGRGFAFLFVLEQLPAVGKTHLVRKIVIAPSDFTKTPEYARARNLAETARAYDDWKPSQPEKFGLRAPKPGGPTTALEHIQGFNLDQSPHLSLSNKPYGPATITGRRPVLVNMEKLKQAGATLTHPEQLIPQLRHHLAQNPGAAPRLQRLIQAVRDWEGETLMEGEVGKGAISKPNATHMPYFKKAEKLAADFADDPARLTHELEALEKSYGRAAKVAKGLRFVGAVGMVVTAYDVGKATQKSIDQRSFKPIAAEGVRQVGGWAAAVAGAKFGGVAGGLVGIETGPGAILTAAGGALIFGAAGYFGFDLIADHIDEN